MVRRGTLRQPGGGWMPVAVKLLNSTTGEQASESYNRHLRTLVQVRKCAGTFQLSPPPFPFVQRCACPSPPSSSKPCLECPSRISACHLTWTATPPLPPPPQPQEVTILGSIRHSNVVQLLGGSLRPGASFLVEELCGKTLSHAIYDRECVAVGPWRGGVLVSLLVCSVHAQRG